MESGKTVGWDWDVKSGRDSWFGDLQTMFGIPAKNYEGCVEDFRRRIHPHDRGRVWSAVSTAMKERGLYSAEFRVVRADGTVRWVAAKGKFYYLPNGEPKRMLGMASGTGAGQHARTIEVGAGPTIDRFAMQSRNDHPCARAGSREWRCHAE
jgi:PAS domain-containing protein